MPLSKKSKCGSADHPQQTLPPLVGIKRHPLNQQLN